MKFATPVAEQGPASSTLVRVGTASDLVGIVTAGAADSALDAPSTNEQEAFV